MRLTCPNCDAQYEVPDEVIPHEGRDVQCSNCGDTWFQAHPENPDAAPDAPAAAPMPEPEVRAEAAPKPAPQAPEDDFHDDYDDDDSGDDGAHYHAPEDVPDDAPEETPPLQQPETDPGISDILREEAKREAQLRASEAQATLESQPDLGLDNAPVDETSRRAREARDRMARMRGQETSEAQIDPGSRRGLLPDIEEISSSLRSSDKSGGSNTAVGPVRTTETVQKRGFSRGFALILIVAVILWLVYINAGRLSDAVPQMKPALDGYVGAIDQARLWLDAKLGQYLPKP